MPNVAPELATATIAGSKAKLALDIPTIHGSCLLKIAKKKSLNLVSFRRKFCGRPEVFWAYLRIGCYDLHGHFRLNKAFRSFSCTDQISSLQP